MGPFLDKPKTEKQNDAGYGNGLQYAVASMQGWRAEMEDAHTAVIGLPNLKDWSFFAVFDGHGGASVASLCSRQLLDHIITNIDLENRESNSETECQLSIEAITSGINAAFINMDECLRSTLNIKGGFDKCGSTAVCVIITPSHIFFANCGDSRAVLSSAGKCTLATTDHKPENPSETARILKAGGSVVMQRVNGLLAVSRAFGDFDLKNVQGISPCKQMVSPEPGVLVYKRETADEFLILACDGVWDVLSNDELCDFVRDRLLISDRVENVCNQVLDTCLYKGSGDNMTVAILTFQGAPKVSEEAVQKETELDARIEQRIKETIESADTTDVDFQGLIHALSGIQGLPPGAGLSAKLKTVEEMLHKIRFSNNDSIRSCNFENVAYSPDKENEETSTKINEDDPELTIALEMDAIACEEVATAERKRKWCFQYLLQLSLFLGCIYIFVCSLSLVGDAFLLLGGKEKGISFADNAFLGNPVAGLMLGILSTVILQSSSTTTAIVISMVGSGDLITVRQAIPIVMGANIGTSMTSTIVSFGLITNMNDFKRAFTGATVHDMFNWFTVMVLLPLETVSRYLETLSKAIVDSFGLNRRPDYVYLETITTPFTNLIIQVDKNIIRKIATEELKNGESIIKHMCCDEITQMTNVTLNGSVTPVPNLVKVNCKLCTFLFERMSREGRTSDSVIGGILLMMSIMLLCACLFCIIKIVRPLQSGYVAYIVRKFISAKFPEKCSFVTGYVALLLGVFVTIVLQSSSIFTSSLTPLVRMDLLNMEWLYPLTLGSNIGTCATGILAAFAQDSDKVSSALQIAFCHLFFNVTGTLMWYPFPFFRPPLIAAKYLGTQVIKYRRFAMMYLIFAFLLLPVVGIGLAFLNKTALASIFIPIAALFAIVFLLNIIQQKCPNILPEKLQSWKWLPEYLRSLRPLDRVLMKILKHCYCCMNISICQFITTDNEDQLEAIDVH